MRTPPEPGQFPIGELAPALTFDGEFLVHRLIAELEPLDERVILVIDDLHELVSPDAQAQLEMLLAQAPPSLRVVLATRRDPRLGLHRLRLTGQLTELRAADLRFTDGEARELFAASGLTIGDDAVASVIARTEGWAAGLRLVALSLARHDDPESFISAITGSNRAVADYLLAELLERQPEAVRRLLLRTSILPRVNGAIADRLTESRGSERILLERHPRHRTAHAALLADVLDALAGEAPAGRGRAEPSEIEPLTESELRVLRYLPTNLTAPEIARELYLSTSTVKTHLRHVYEKLGVQRRTAAVERARALGLIGSTTRRRPPRA